MSTQAPYSAIPRPTGRGGLLMRAPLLGLGVVLFLAFYGPSLARSTPHADTILIVKHERKLYLLHYNYPLRSYRIALGLSPTGAKEHQWDFRSPADLKRSSALHLPAGGDISPIDPPSLTLITKPVIGPMGALLSPIGICKICGN
jgi:hypothetical protein